MLLSDLILSKEQINKIAIDFKHDMQRGRSNSGPLKMLPSFLKLPGGNEQGDYAAVDFGGTNLRVLKVHLNGNRKIEIIRQISKQLKTLGSTSDELFDFIADMLGSIANNMPCGFTFSYGCEQKSAVSARLIKWTKEIDITGVIGQDVGQLLQEALYRKKINLELKAVLNDTVATLLAGAYMYDYADIGSICGTGHNSCYYDKDLKMIINIESGNFDCLPFTGFDEQVNADSDYPGEQRLEKMVSAKYLSELIRIIFKDRLKKNQIPSTLSDKLDCQYSISMQQLADTDYRSYPEAKKIIDIIITRAAQLVAATYLGIIAFSDKDMLFCHRIAIDGALFTNNSLFQNTITKTITAVLGKKAAVVAPVHVHNGSGLGAAVAAGT